MRHLGGRDNSIWEFVPARNRSDASALIISIRRKPGRFARLKELTHSQAFPPPLVAYYDDTVAQQTRQRFQVGLMTANSKEKGQRLLTLFKLTGFEVPPKDFAQVLAETRKAYPPSKEAAK